MICLSKDVPIRFWLLRSRKIPHCPAFRILVKNAVQAFDSILAGGVSTLEVKSVYGLTTDQELRLLKLLKKASRKTPLDIVYTFLGAHIAPQDGPTPEEFTVIVGKKMLPKIQQQGIAEFHDISCEIGDFSAPMAAYLLKKSRETGIPTRVHADASSDSRGWRTAVQGGAIAADHLTYTKPDQYPPLHDKAGSTC